MHPTEGDLRAYHDDQISAAERGWIEAHLATCPDCRRRADRLSRRAAWVQDRLTLLAPAQPPQAAEAALARLASHPPKARKRGLMKTLPVSRQYQPLWSGLAVAAVLLIALLLPPVRALATDFLGLFRVQRIEVVEVNPANLPEHLRPAVLFERMFTDNFQLEEYGETEDVDSAATAGALAGFPVRLPTAAEGEPRIRVQPGAKVTLTIDLAQVRTLLRELGHAEIVLPDSLDGRQVIIEIPWAVTAAYGDCPGGDEPPGSCVRLLQLPSPTVSAPPELDVDRLGATVLQIMGLSEAEATSFSERVDWSTTLVVPIPSNRTNYREVQVDGVPGALIEQYNEGSLRYIVLWVRDGIVYALVGAQSADEALAIANSLQ